MKFKCKILGHKYKSWKNLTATRVIGFANTVSYIKIRYCKKCNHFEIKNVVIDHQKQLQDAAIKLHNTVIKASLAVNNLNLSLTKLKHKL